MPAFNDPGIIRFELGDRILSTHYRDELFEDGPIELEAGSLTLSNGFVASLAADLGAGHGFSLSEGAELSIVDSVDNVKALALEMEKAGVNTAELFGDGDVGITLRDTPENIQAALLEPGLALFGNITAVDLVLEGGEDLSIRIPLDKYDSKVDWSAFSSVEVFGTLKDYLDHAEDLTGLDVPVTFVVEDSLAAFSEAESGGTTPDDGNLSVVAASDFRIFGTITDLNDAFGVLYETAFDGSFNTYGAIDTLTNIDNASSGGELSDIEFVMVEDTATALAGFAAIDASAIDAVRVIDTVANVQAADYTDTYLQLTTEVIASDSAEAIAGLLGDPIDGPVSVANGVQLTGIEVTSATTPLALGFDDIIDLELASLRSFGGALQLQASTAELAAANFGLVGGTTVLERFATLEGTDLYAVDTATAIQGLLAAVDDLETALFDALAGVNLIESVDDELFNTLSIDAAYLSSDTDAKATAGITDKQLIFNAIDDDTFISIDTFDSGAGVVAAASFRPDLYINQDAGAAGGADISVIDSASTLRDLSDEPGTELLALDESPDDQVFTVAGLPVRFTHEVEYSDIYDAGEDGTLGTLDDVPQSLPSFEFAADWYQLQPSVFETHYDPLTPEIAPAFTLRLTIDGPFDVESNGVEKMDVVDISSLTDSFDTDTDPRQDFAFVPALSGSRFDAEEDEFLTVDGRDAVDIAVSELDSTLIEFDGLLDGELYDGVADFEIFLPNVLVQGQQDTDDLNGDSDTTDINNGITVLSFFGIPLIDQITGDSFLDDTTFPNLEILRFEGQDVYGTALQAYDILETRFHGTPDVRNLEVNNLFNIEGDLQVGDGGGSGDPVNDVFNGDSLDGTNDVLFGLDGNDTLRGETGNDYLHGGDGNDDLHGDADDDFLVGGEGNDDLWGGGHLDQLFGGLGNDRLWGGDQEDSLFGNDGNDTLNGGAGNDDLVGGDGNDTADYSESLAPVIASLVEGSAGGEDVGTDTLTGIENLTGGEGNDALTGDTGDNILRGGGGIDTLNGGDGADTLLGGTGADTLNGGIGNDELRGGAGADLLTGGDGDDIFSFFAANEFGDTISDFTKITGNTDSIEIGRGALPSEARLTDYGLIGDPTAFLTGSTLVFAVQGIGQVNSRTADGGIGAFAGYGFEGFGGEGDVTTLGPGAQAVPILYGYSEFSFNAGYYESGGNGFASALQNELVGMFAPTQIPDITTTFNSAAFTETTEGELKLVTPVTAPAFGDATAPGRFVVFGMVRNITSSSTALVMAYINNGSNGNSIGGGLNALTSSEISAFTVAVFDPELSTTLSEGDVLLI